MSQDLSIKLGSPKSVTQTDRFCQAACNVARLRFGDAMVPIVNILCQGPMCAAELSIVCELPLSAVRVAVCSLAKDNFIATHQSNNKTTYSIKPEQYQRATCYWLRQMCREEKRLSISYEEPTYICPECSSTACLLELLLDKYTKRPEGLICVPCSTPHRMVLLREQKQDKKQLKRLRKRIVQVKKSAEQLLPQVTVEIKSPRQTQVWMSSQVGTKSAEERDMDEIFEDALT